MIEVNELDITLKFLEDNGFTPDSSWDFRSSLISPTSPIYPSFTNSVNNNGVVIKVLEGKLIDISFFGRKGNEYLKKYNSNIKQILRGQQLNKLI